MSGVVPTWAARPRPSPASARHPGRRRGAASTAATASTSASVVRRVEEHQVERRLGRLGPRPGTTRPSTRWTCAAASKPVAARLARMRGSRPRGRGRRAPRSRAAARAPRSPSAPLPAYRSSTVGVVGRAGSERREQRLLHPVGASGRASPFGATSRRPPTDPAITRSATAPSYGRNERGRAGRDR